MAEQDKPPPNHDLRAARLRLTSPSRSGRPMSCQEVADAINQHLSTPVDDKYIGKLERGEIRWPGPERRAALRRVFGVDQDVDIGLHITRTQPTATMARSAQGRRPAGEEMQPGPRTGPSRVSGTVVALPWMELLTPVEATPVPTKVHRNDIDQVHTAVRVFASWDNIYGGGLAREAVFAQLRWAAQLLHANCPEKLRPELFAAVAQLGTVAGFMAFDACAHDNARRTFRFGLACAEQSGNWHLRAGVLADMTRQANWCGQPDDGLTFAEVALVRADRLTMTERAALHTLRARALAKLHRAQDTLSAVGAADEAFSRANPTADPPWMAYYDHAQHHGDTGHALFDLSISGQRTQAAQRLAYSVIHHGDAYARSRAMSQTKLASLLTVVGDPREAAAVGQQALRAAASLRSRRADDDLWELHRFAQRHPHVAEAVELRDRIFETLSVR